MARLFHVSSVANRDSILAYGLDWTRMGAAPGIAGSLAPEADGFSYHPAPIPASQVILNHRPARPDRTV